VCQYALVHEAGAVLNDAVGRYPLAPLDPDQLARLQLRYGDLNLVILGKAQVCMPVVM